MTREADATHVAGPPDLGDRLGDLLARRTDANRSFFPAEAERIARLCHRMAERFARGGRLVAFGRSPAARSDVRHVAVEFVHPVIVGKRALPAIGLSREGESLPAQVDLVAEPADVAIAFGTEEGCEATAAALTTARERGCLTIAFSPAGAEWEFEPPGEDPFVRQELVETLYHVLWELVHVFFEHPGLLEGRDDRRVHDTGASSFLYPFLGQQEHDLEGVMADVRRSVLMKAEDAGALREQTLTEGADELIAAARALRGTFEAGGKLLALGNGGSATDAMDAVADFRAAGAARFRDDAARPPAEATSAAADLPAAGLPAAGAPAAAAFEAGAREAGPAHATTAPKWPPRRALDLTEDAGILTAIANDIGTDAIFARQIIAYGREGDAVLTLSTSGNSGSVVEALIEARRRGLRTIAMVGYDGGRVVAEDLADHAIVTRSEHIPRIQEAQASAYHALRELVELAG